MSRRTFYNHNAPSYDGMSEKIALDNGCAALITGESLGQVASQTIGAIACTDEAANMPVFQTSDRNG